MAIAGYAGLTAGGGYGACDVACHLAVSGTDKIFYKPFRKANFIKVVMASFGMMLIIRSAVQVIWGQIS
jgi:branched-chain amino acid transport system permease protein